MSTLSTLWRTAEHANPDAIALISEGERLTYATVGRRIRALASGMVRHWNIQPGEVVALLAPNSSAFVTAYFAVAHTGAIIQPVDERLTPEEIKAVLADSGARSLIVHGSLWPKIDGIRGALPALDRLLGVHMTAAHGHRYEAWLDHADDTWSGPVVHAHEIAELMYTSGTSGEPKSVMRSHANVLAAAQNAQRGFGYLGNDIMAIVMPLSHSSALTSQMVPLIAQGGTLVLLERFDIKDLLRTIRAEQVTCLRAVPAMLRLLLTTPEFCADHLPSLRLLMNSSASIDPATLNEVKRRFPTIEIVNSYGLTEASTCTMLPDAAIVTRPDSVGRPIDGIDMSVMDETGNPVEDGVEGEICVRGAHVFAGYRNRPEETDTAFRAGWFRTGDIGHRDAEGFYYLHGRLGEYINCGGRTFSAAEVEQCVLRVPDVSEAAVIAIAHRVLGHVAKAFVVPRQGAHPNPKTIINHCTRHLPSFKVPFSVKIVSEIPKSSTGKTLHRKLKEAAHD